MKILENVHPKNVYTYPIIELSPTQTPGKIMAQPPIHTFFPIWIGFANSHPAFRVSASLKFGALPKFVCLKAKSGEPWMISCINLHTWTNPSIVTNVNLAVVQNMAIIIDVDVGAQKNIKACKYLLSLFI